MTIQRLTRYQEDIDWFVGGIRLISAGGGFPDRKSNGSIDASCMSDAVAIFDRVYNGEILFIVVKASPLRDLKVAFRLTNSCSLEIKIFQPCEVSSWWLVNYLEDVDMLDRLEYFRNALLSAIEFRVTLRYITEVYMLDFEEELDKLVCAEELAND